MRSGGLVDWLVGYDRVEGVEDERQQEPEPSQDAGEVVADGGQDGVDSIAVRFG